jgi:rhamnulokinase
MANRAHLAFDLGAESGRAMIGVLRNDRLALREVHRFANRPQRLPSGYHWNLLDLWANLKTALAAAVAHARQHDLQFVSLGVDTWGVDFGLVGAGGQLLGLPFAYRDQRNPPAREKALQLLGAERIYEETGIQFLPFNSLFQLIAQRDAEPAMLEHAQRLLFMPDLLHYFFSGEQVNESTIASTSQMIDPRTGDWAVSLMHDLGLPTHMLGTIAPAGTVIGPVSDDVAGETGADASLKVIAPASHDTASAVAAVPVTGSGGSWCYLSSGTWSLMGVELDEPLVSAAARAVPFTNEGGVERTIRFLKNIAGLWLVQEIRRHLEHQGKQYDYPTLTRMAADAPPLVTLVDPAYEPFGTPGNMPEKIAAFARRTDQPVPQEIGAMVRCCLESLAMTYRHTLLALEKVLGRQLDVIHIVGGGGRNALLNQMTADATGRLVIAGPSEATAAGNIMVQAMGNGAVSGLAEIRRVIARSFELTRYEPADTATWDDAYARYRAVLTG